MNAFWWFLLGFGCAAALAIGWHMGLVRPRLEALQQLAEDRLKAGIETLKGKF